MKTTIIYRYKRDDGGVTVSPIKPAVAYTEAYRLIADDGKALTQDNVNLTPCVDVISIDGWYEVEVESAQVIEQIDIEEKPWYKEVNSNVLFR